MEAFTKLVNLMERLRGKDGCPWDKKQRVTAFKTYLLEEVYELIDAIDQEDFGSLKEELGDLLFHIIFIAQICAEQGHFTINDVVSETYEKMYRRHPHVFTKDSSGKPIAEQWEEIKKKEKEDYSPIGGVPKTLPALLRANIISKRAAHTGFDWEKLDHIYDKLEEEIAELREAEQTGSKEAVEDEIGDLLFTVVNISRHHGIDPENALRGTIDKFTRRFAYVEKCRNGAELDLNALDALWNEIKEQEKEGK